MLFIRTTCVTKTKSIQHIKDGNYAIRLHSVASSARYPVISDPSGFGCLESTGAKLIIISYSQVRLPGLAVVGFRYEFQVACKRASLSKHVYIYFPTKNRTISLIRKGFIEVLFQVYKSCQTGLDEGVVLFTEVWQLTVITGNQSNNLNESQYCATFGLVYIHTQFLIWLRAPWITGLFSRTNQHIEWKRNRWRPEGRRRNKWWKSHHARWYSRGASWMINHGLHQARPSDSSHDDDCRSSSSCFCCCCSPFFCSLMKLQLLVDELLSWYGPLF